MSFHPDIHPDYTSVPTDVDPEEASRKWLCLNCYNAPRRQGSELCAECETLWEPEQEPQRFDRTCLKCGGTGMRLWATEDVCDACFDPEVDLSPEELVEDEERRDISIAPSTLLNRIFELADMDGDKLAEHNRQKARELRDLRRN